jgi:hypothetical protein
MVVLFSATTAIVAMFGGFLDSFLAHDTKNGLLLRILLHSLPLLNIHNKRIHGITACQIHIMPHNPNHNKVVQDKKEVKYLIIDRVDFWCNKNRMQCHLYDENYDSE